MKAAPIGGRIFTRGFNILLALGGLAGVLLIWRFVSGLGATTNMNDGYPWGIWIAFDVVTGTAIACGGYAVALIVYVLNRGKYHPMVRSALLTTALGYTVAGASVVIDLGRWWNVWKVPTMFWRWNGNSALLEVALCIMSYMMVAWIEVSHSMVEKWEHEAKWPWLQSFAKRVTPGFNKALPFIIALGILLPTMHQSSLGTMFVISTKLHPLWHTQLLPGLFLISVIGMGYAGVVFEATLSGLAFKLESEWKLLGELAKAVSWTFFGYIALRLIDLSVRGFPGFGANVWSALFIFELILFAVPAIALLSPKVRANPGAVFASGLCGLFAGGLYRFDVYLVAYMPGSNYHYFPSVQETLITVGLVAFEIAGYVLVVKFFPILRPAVRNP